MAKREPAPIKFPPDAPLAALYDRFVDIAITFPDVHASRSYGTPALKVKTRLMARLRSEAEGGLAIRCDLAERAMLLQAAPETFYITDHYANADMVLINLATLRWNAAPGIIEHAWRIVALPTLIKEYGQSLPYNCDQSVFTLVSPPRNVGQAARKYIVIDHNVMTAATYNNM